ncbi:MAG TPA: DUF2141 domain-containing protein [Bacteroidales bacterium]|nr:DUF2141 domain-containing protein [Bacteroidales bacterium]
MKLNVLLWLIILTSGISYSQSPQIEITITNIRNSQGTIKWAVFKNETQFKTYTTYVDAGYIQAKEGSLIIKTKEIPDGNYAVSVYHDENNNSKIDFNFLGLPMEGFGFSNNPTIYFGLPAYTECVFEKKGKSNKSIKVKYYL